MPILKCSWCNNDFHIREAEYNRQIRNGRLYFFCNRSCAAKKNNASRPNRRIEIEKVCPHCKKKFITQTGCKSATFCSRSCASAGSMSEKRREAQHKGGKDKIKNLIPPEETLRLRKMWKYTKLKSFLKFCDEPFEFEFRLGNFIFDLALPNRCIFVEFDGLYHNGKQSKIDFEKDQYAKQNDWKVIRKKVQNNTVINPDIIYPILSYIPDVLQTM